MKKKLKLALFDIDGTIFRSSLFLELFYALIDEGVFPKKAEREVRPYFTAWLDRKGHYNDYLIKVVQVHYRYLTGKSKAQVDRITRLMIERRKDRVYRYTRDLIQQLKKEGYFLIAISNSQEYVVSRFAKEAGFDAALARRLEVTGGKYTGRVMSGDRVINIKEHVDKVQVLKDFLRERNLDADLKQSVAVGDSEGDIAILSLVGRPIAFNPSSGLATIAKKKGWHIVVERKDAVYEIGPDCNIIDKSEKQKARWK